MHATSSSEKGRGGSGAGAPEESGWGRGVDRVQRGCLHVKICWRHRRIPLALRLHNIERATPRDSTGLASVREKRRSRHACQALLLWLYGPSVRYAYRLASIPGLPRVSLPSSLRYSPTATYDYGNCLHLAGGPSASAVHRLSQGFAGSGAWNSLGRHTQKLLKPRSSIFSPRTRGRVMDEKGCQWSRRSAPLATGQRRHPPEQVR
jgi:hypothetical protein